MSFVVEPPVFNGVRAHFGDIALSADGRTLAYVAFNDSVSQVYLRRLDDVESKPLAITSAAATISYSPDGKWLSVTTGPGKIMKAATDGSSATDVIDGVNQRGPAAWAKDRSLIIGHWGGANGGLERVTSSGAVQQLTTPAPAWSHGLPFVTPDEKTLLFMDWGPGFTEDD